MIINVCFMRVKVIFVYDMNKRLERVIMLCLSAFVRYSQVCYQLVFLLPYFLYLNYLLEKKMNGEI